jgi:hypothetical protein
MKPIIYLLVLLVSRMFSQTFSVSGKVSDKETGMPLGYTNIRVSNSTMGTSSNLEGEYEIKLQAGNYRLVASYIGYKSATLSVKVNSNLSNINFNLTQTDVALPEVVVLPGENPALEIIRKAIEKKKKRDEKISGYEFEAYTKGVMKTTNEIKAGSNSINLSVGSSDTLMISGIIENESKGYFQKPDNYKEVITARKQTANFPSTVNILTGGRVMQNFYNDEISFIGIYLPGPLADNSPSYYYFYIEKTVAIDDKIVYKIHMTPDDESNPGFTGDIFILDKTFDLIKVNLTLNKAANPGGIFDTVNVFQQFSSYSDSVYMPVDYRILATANYLNIFRFGFELNTILYNYDINPDIDENVFSKAIVTVKPDADKKDSLYWVSTQTIPNTEEETDAYHRIDSIKNIPVTFWDDFSILSARMRLSDDFSVTGPLGLYHFNSIEGHSLDYGFYLNNAFDRRFNSFLKLSYGFSDRKLKTDFYCSYLFGDYRTYKLELNAFKRINVLFGDSGGDSYSQFFESLSELFFKTSVNDYYYSDGFDVKLTGEVFPVLELSLGYLRRTDNNAYNNTDFSFFAKDKKYNINSPIYETRINAITAGFRLDFRDYIEDGYSRRRISFGGSYITFGGNVTYSNSEFLRSNLDFTKYDLWSFTNLRTFSNCVLNLKTDVVYSYGKVPFQMLYPVAGNIDYFSRSYTFRTLDYNVAFGDRVAAIYLEHYFGSELFRWLSIPGLKDWDIFLDSFLNGVYTDLSGGSKSIIVVPQKLFKNPLYEIGFGIGHQLIPFELVFAWRLNHRGENNFRIGINSFFY